MSMQIHPFSSNQAAAQALAQAVAGGLRQALAADAQGRALLLVSGGRSPLPFFAAMAEQPLPWQHIDISLVDERSVPLDHADSNAALVSQYLLQGPAQAARLLPMMAPPQPGESPWHWAQRSAAAANRNAALQRPAALVLGLGSDGHTASLFRDAPQWREATSTGDRYLAVQPGQAPHPRVSLSLSALIDQGRCYVWSVGAAKLDVIKGAQAPAGAAPPDAAGAFALLAAHPDVTLDIFHADS